MSEYRGFEDTTSFFSLYKLKTSFNFPLKQNPNVVVPLTEGETIVVQEGKVYVPVDRILETTTEFIQSIVSVELLQLNPTYFEQVNL